MDKNTVFEKIYNYGIVPVIVINSVSDAAPLAKALCSGGLPVAEVTFRTACAADAIAAIRENEPDMLVGAGTVLTVAQAEAAIAAGAGFIVAPGFNPKLADWCLTREIPYLPGCATPTEIEAALGFGLDTLKFFPAETLGGIAALKALSAPYGKVRFVPTGGIGLGNIAAYASEPKVLAVGGSFMVKKELIAADRFDEIERLTREAVFAFYGFELAHVGINCADSDDAESKAAMLGGIFGLATKPGSGSMFAGTIFELMRGKYYGANGHIAISTNTIERAMGYIERLGFTFEPDGVKYNAEGKLNAAYIKGDFGGFAIHLLRKA